MRKSKTRLLVAASLAALVAAVPMAQGHRTDKPHHAVTKADRETYLGIRAEAKKHGLAVGPKISTERSARFHATKIRWLRKKVRAHNAAHRAAALASANTSRQIAPNANSTGSSVGSSSGASYGGPTPPQSIAQCESGGNPRAVSPDGRYRGKWQFDQQTWESVGGSGDPAAASEAEQDMRAGKLYAQRGAQPWPVCGR